MFFKYQKGLYLCYVDMTQDKKITTMTKQEFSKTVKIYKSHNRANGFISITFARILGPGAMSTETTRVLEKNGGALNTLYMWLVEPHSR